MDVPRINSSNAWNLKKRLVLLALVGVVVTALLAFMLWPAGPVVRREDIWIGAAKEGPVTLGVDGTGKLIPEVSSIVSAMSIGRIESISVRPGAGVTSATVILTMVNPEVEQAARDARWQLQVGEADLADLRSRLGSQLMDLKAQAASAQAQSLESTALLAANEKLAADGLVSAISLKVLKAKAAAAAILARTQEDRIAAFRESMTAQVAAEQARVGQLQEQAVLRKKIADGLQVRAGIDGILQEINVEVGQQVSLGAPLAKVIQPGALKAELKVPAPQAKYLSSGLEAEINSPEGIVLGRVNSFEPSVQGGTITVDIRFESSLPPGLRPDQTVEGTIVLKRLPQALYIPRPASCDPERTVFLYKIQSGGRTAVRTQVVLGEGSANAVLVREGLKKGDEVILSDTSSYDGASRLRVR